MGFPWPGELWLSQAVEANKATRRCDIAPRLKETSTVMLPKNHRPSQVKNEVLQSQGDILTCFLVLSFFGGEMWICLKIQHVAPINVNWTNRRINVDFTNNNFCYGTMPVLGHHISILEIKTDGPENKHCSRNSDFSKEFGRLKHAMIFNKNGLPRVQNNLNITVSMHLHASRHAQKQNNWRRGHVLWAVTCSWPVWSYISCMSMSLFHEPSGKFDPTHPGPFWVHKTHTHKCTFTTHLPPHQRNSKSVCDETETKWAQTKFKSNNTYM